MTEIFKPRVTIVIPVYNGEKYIERAINSALNQTYKNIEIIVINDGSVDETEKIVMKYKDKIKYLRKENGGVSTALNLAIKNMKGEYFSWLSHDDMYKPEKIEKQVDYLKKQKEKNVILYSNYDLIDEENNIISVEIKDHNKLLKKPEYSILEGAINGITLLIPTKAFEDMGFFNENLYCTQDYDMWIRMFKKYKFIHQEDVLASSRIHPRQETNVNPKVLLEGNALWINIIESFDKETKISLEGSEYKYYLKMYNFLKNSQYYMACKYIQKKCKALKDEADFNKNDFKERITIKRLLNKCKTFLSLLRNNPKKLKMVIYTKIKHKN